MESGEVEVDALVPITWEDITPELARESGFDGVLDLIKTAKHGRGQNLYLVRFHYLGPDGAQPRSREPKSRQHPAGRPAKPRSVGGS